MTKLGFKETETLPQDHTLSSQSGKYSEKWEESYRKMGVARNTTESRDKVHSGANHVHNRVFLCVLVGHESTRDFKQAVPGIFHSFPCQEAPMNRLSAI
jgi:hypothetical protein